MPFFCYTPRPHTKHMATVEITDNNFKDSISEGLVLVDFWAPWCGPCRIVGPVLEELSDDFDGKVKIGKLNVDENPNTAGQFRVMSIPTMILFKDGEPVEQLVGAQPKRAFETMLNKHLESAN